MFPENRLSTILVADDFTDPYSRPRPNKLTDYVMGGIGLGDTSQGLDVQVWTATYENGGVVLSAPSLQTNLQVFIQPDITELSVAFDQNMNVAIAFIQYGTARLYWFDTTVGAYVITEFAGALTPRVTLDDRRTNQSGSSDLILGYTRNDSLYIRIQRDRFENEYLMQENVQAELTQMGMNVKNRFQFKLLPYRR